MNASLAVAALHFGSGFGAVMSSLLKKQVNGRATIVECLTRWDPATSCRDLLELLERPPLPAALLGIAIRPAPDVVAAFRAQGVPVVLIDEEADGATTVGCDNLAGGLLAGQHVVRTGRKHPAVVCGVRSVGGGRNAVLRVRGFERAIAAAGLRLAPEDVVEVVDYSRKDGVNAMLELLKRPGIDVVFCAAGDLCAMGMLSVARQHRIPVPERMAFIGFDDHPLSGVCDPPMTTVRQPLERIAAEALRLATEEAAAIHASPQRALFDPELIVRRSA